MGESQRCSYQGFEDVLLYVDQVRHSYSENTRKVDNKISNVINDLVTGAGVVGLEYVPSVGKKWVFGNCRGEAPHFGM